MVGKTSDGDAKGDTGATSGKRMAEEAGEACERSIVVSIRHGRA
jgi:hypothetical protein